MKKYLEIILFCVLAAMIVSGVSAQTAETAIVSAAPDTQSVPGDQAADEDITLSDDSSDFVILSEAVPDAILEIRYYSTFNFVGDRIDGYEEPLALLTKEAAAALRAVSDDLVLKGYRLKIYDAYRPQKAVSHFMRWAQDAADTRTQAAY